jgi:hypothetical protein
VDEAAVYPQAGVSGAVRFPVSAGYIIDESGDFTFTENGAGTPANVLKVLGLPAGVTINQKLSNFANVNTAGASHGTGDLYLDVDESTLAGRYPITVSLGSDAALNTTFDLYVQEFTLNPTNIEVQLYAKHNIKIGVSGRFIPKAGEYNITLPAVGSNRFQLYRGLTITATTFVVGQDGNGKGTITIAGESGFDGYVADRSMKITAAGLEAALNAHRIDAPGGTVNVDLADNYIEGAKGAKVTIKVSVSNFTVYSRMWDWLDQLPASGSSYFYTANPVVEIPAGSGITLNEEESWFSTKTGGGTGSGELVLNLGNVAGSFEHTFSFGARTFGITNARAFTTFFVVVR